MIDLKALYETLRPKNPIAWDKAVQLQMEFEGILQEKCYELESCSVEPEFNNAAYMANFQYYQTRNCDSIEDEALRKAQIDFLKTREDLFFDYRIAAVVNVADRRYQLTGVLPMLKTWEHSEWHVHFGFFTRFKLKHTYEQMLESLATGKVLVNTERDNQLTFFGGETLGRADIILLRIE